LLKDKDAHWFCFYYTVSFGGFVGLASSYVLYFKSEFGLTPVHAGDLAALCTAAGALLRPVGGSLADRIGGIRALYRCYTVAGIALILAAVGRDLAWNLGALIIASGALGMAPDRSSSCCPALRQDLGVMTGLVGSGGGIGGFYLASSLSYSKGLTGSYLAGLTISQCSASAQLSGWVL
jgi:NNP family nitrate/nitrite transporter-like MFS transporter